ncbi:hypothetical protein FSP39_018937 [Pinctada imbricata]|uniref:Uncharacterized protein n=1 Tax=Pinctada imbricata TaxID=66713 RepID=A0AA88Y278_PINIB|nr:hypothetical protein FSP39_018937 [Pinctada imbricata]
MSSHMRQNVTKLTSSLFFVNIQDLNHRITSGKVSRTVGFSYKPVARRNFIDTSSGFPAFVSPRKQGNLKEKKPNDRRSFPFDPPLLAKRNQRPEPPFFAGSDQPYKLPQKLPDKIEFVENGVMKRSVSVLSEAASDISVTEDTKTGSVSEMIDEHSVKKNTSASSDVPHERTLVEETNEEAVFEETQVQVDREQASVRNEQTDEDNTCVHTDEDNTGVYTEEDNTGVYTEDVIDSEDRSDAKTPTPSLEDEEDDAIIDSQMFDSELDW